MRVLFCMFAEDIGLFGNDPKQDRPFADFLRTTFDPRPAVREAARRPLAVDGPGAPSTAGRMRSTATLAISTARLFLDTKVFVLAQAERGELLRAAEHDWQNVEPRSSAPCSNRRSHPASAPSSARIYTPPYVERIVEATITDVLRPEWESLEAGLEGWRRRSAGRLAASTSDSRHRVLDPACGTGNFLMSRWSSARP
jgi:hypothetical protein